MEIALVRFIGVGMVLVLPRPSDDLAADTAARGGDLVRQLAGAGHPFFKPLIERSVAQVCRGWRSIQVPDAVALDHLEALTTIMAGHQIQSGRWADILLAAEASGGHADLAEAAAQDIAAEIVEAARADGRLQRSGLLVPVSLVMIERLFATVFADFSTLRGLASGIAYPASELAGVNSEGTKDWAAFAKSVARIAPDVCPPALLEALVRLDRANGLGAGLINSRLEDKALAAQELQSAIETCAAAVTDPGAAWLLHEAGLRMQSGDLDATDALLQSAFEIASEDKRSACAGAAAHEVGLLQAGFDALRSNWIGAAVRYGLLRRAATDIGLGNRRQVILRQAQALIHHGEQTGDLGSWHEAAQLQAQAGSLIQEQDAPLDWASGHLETGNLLLKLAAREGNPARFMAAALHFKPASDVFSRESDHDGWALAQLGLAECLRGQGEVQGDPVLLSDGVFAYRAALGVLTRARSPEEWVAAKAGLGATLVRFAEETGETSDIPEAVAALELALAVAAGSKQSWIEAALGRAYVVLADETDDIGALVKAVPLLEHALASGNASGDAAGAAAMQRLVGSSLWTLGEAKGDRIRLQEALSTLASARDGFAGLGDVKAARDATTEIVRKQDTLAAMRRPLRHNQFPMRAVRLA